MLVRYFAAAAEVAGRDEENVFAASVGELRGILLERYPAMAKVLESGSFLVDGVVTRDANRTITAKVDVLPPFSGG